MYRKIVKPILVKTRLHRPALDLYKFTLKLLLARRNARLRAKGTPDGQPVPPDELIFTVAGSADVKWFLHTGQLAFETIEDVLKRNSAPLASLRRVLDFGCGCGRVVRYWQCQPAKVYGTDYNSDLIRWCEANLPAAAFGVNSLAPPLTYESETFDLVYALSVFTHLSEDLQLAWMDELRRVIRPGGLLFITLHGRYYLECALNEAERAKFEAGQLVVMHANFNGSNTCAVYHPESYVREKMLKGFTLVDYISEGALGNPRQDVYLLRRNA